MMTPFGERYLRASFKDNRLPSRDAWVTRKINQGIRWKNIWQYRCKSRDEPVSSLLCKYTQYSIFIQLYQNNTFFYNCIIKMKNNYERKKIMAKPLRTIIINNNNNIIKNQVVEVYNFIVILQPLIIRDIWPYTVGWILKAIFSKKIKFQLQIARKSWDYISEVILQIYIEIVQGPAYSPILSLSAVFRDYYLWICLR